MLWECSLRGRYRLTQQSFLPGDRVVLSVVDREKKKAVIESVKPRQNQLIRPAIANVEQALLVFAALDPLPDLMLLDRLLIAVQSQKMRPVICFNKVDLLSQTEQEALRGIYAMTGFPILMISVKEAFALEGLKERLAGKISVFAGPSGAGKSSLVNALEPGLSLKTGMISEKLGRGKHTTRHVELLQLTGGGLVADTPGFSQLFLPKDMKRESLRYYYPDFQSLPHCRFSSCLHRDEPGCAIREAVEQGVLDRDRFSRYLFFLEEIMVDERRY